MNEPWEGSGLPEDATAGKPEEEIEVRRSSQFTAMLEPTKPEIIVQEKAEESDATEFDFRDIEGCFWTLADARILHVMLGKAIAEAEKWERTRAPK